MKLCSLLSVIRLPIFITVLLIATAAWADSKAVTAKDGWVRALPANLPAAGYLTLENHGKQPIDVIAVESPDYRKVMLHQTITNGSTTKMVGVKQLTIPAQGTVSIAPGGYHIMLEQPKHPISPGDTVHIDLKLSDGTLLSVPMLVKPPTQ